MSFTVHLIIKGKVQGVFFRVSAKKKAEQLQVNGWVKNTKSGDVEAMASGEMSNVELFIEWCRKGPEHATVTDVVVEEKEYTPVEGFEIVR